MPAIQRLTLLYNGFLLRRLLNYYTCIISYIPVCMTDVKHPSSLINTLVYTVSQKTVQNSFCQNFVKFPPSLKIFAQRSRTG